MGIDVMSIFWKGRFRRILIWTTRCGEGDCHFSPPSVSELEADNLCAKTIGRKVMSITNIA